MNIRLSFLTIFLFIQLGLYAQEPGGSLITETGILKAPFRLSNNPTIAGTPFLYNEFVHGTIIFGNGNRSDVSKLNYEASGGFLVFFYNNETWQVNSFVRGFVLRSALDNGIMKERLFLNGYPSINSNDSTTYYEVLVNGELQLLSNLKKVIKLNEGYGVASYNEYVIQEEYYLYDGTELKPISDKGNFLDLLPASHRKKAETIMKEQKMNLKKFSSIKELLIKLNE